MKTPKEEVLYFPSIEFHDDSWLKGALCHWEKIYRIVPPSYSPRDSDEVLRAIDAGLVESIHVGSVDLEVAAHRFVDFWDTTPFVPAGFGGDANEGVNLHLEKVDERIRARLLSLSSSINAEGFVKLDSRTANSYMLFLAESLARNHSIPKITDDRDMFSAMQYFEHNGNFDEAVYNEERNEVISTLALGSLVPAGIDTYSMDSIIAFRNRTDEGREAFRLAVAELINELKGIHDKDYFFRRIARFDEELRKSRKTISQVLKQDGTDMAYALFSVGLPMAFTTFGALALLGDPWSFQKIGGSAFLGVVSTIADQMRTRRKHWAPQDASYWMSLNSAFSNGESIQYKLPNFHRSFEEFVND